MPSLKPELRAKIALEIIRILASGGKITKTDKTAALKALADLSPESEVE